MPTEADREEVARRLIYLQGELADSSLYTSVTWEVFQTDRRKRRELERWVENIVNCVIDISKVIIESRDIPVPETYRDVLRNIDASSLFKKGLGEKLSRWAKMRSVLAHEYLDIRWGMIGSFLKEVDVLAKDFMEGAESFLQTKK